QPAPHASDHAAKRATIGAMSELDKTAETRELGAGNGTEGRYARRGIFGCRRGTYRGGLRRGRGTRSRDTDDDWTDGERGLVIVPARAERGRDHRWHPG